MKAEMRRGRTIRINRNIEMFVPVFTNRPPPACLHSVAFLWRKYRNIALPVSWKLVNNILLVKFAEVDML